MNANSAMNASSVMKTNRKRTLRRRGMSGTQAAVLLALITVAVLIAVRSLGSNTSTDLNRSAGNVANPASLPARFGS
jgi:hypothetical protein